MLRSTDRTIATPVTDWTVAGAPPDCVRTPSGLDQLSWLPARVPGTAAGALRDAGRWIHGDTRNFDAEDWWFRSRLLGAQAADGEELVLGLGGIATLSEVFLDGELVLSSESMFQPHEVGLDPRTHDGAEVAIRCRALTPVLAKPRPPRARWRPQIAAGGLRHQRTMLLGRSPGSAPAPAAVGPWRGVVVERRRDLAVDQVQLRARLNGPDGRLAVTAELRGLGGATVISATAKVAGPSGTHVAQLVLTGHQGALTVAGEVVVPNVALWWAHTHGEPSLHEVRLNVSTSAGPVQVDAGRVGFRRLATGPPGHDIATDGLDLRLNGVKLFARGAVWTPLDLVGLAPTDGELRSALIRVRDAGMNMLRVAGTAAYESVTFHDLCDELGLLVWQDFMFANFDYPVSNAAFRSAVTDECRQVLADLAWRPSLAVLCGNSEVEQQAAMLGVASAEARCELFGELLPRLVREAEADAPYVPSTPFGGDLPFRPGSGVAHYYGVGGYRRPLTDVRLAGVRFAAECLALANIPDGEAVASIGVPRDVGAPWDFADVRDHYLAVLYDIDVASMRKNDPDHYLELARATSGELMAEVFGEWRRAASPCGGGLVLWLTDLAPGAGWGVIDHRGVPKVAYHHLRRALAPVAVWLTNEGLAGLDVHVANDRPTPLSARLRVAFYRDREVLVDEARADLQVAPHGVARYGVEELLGHFVDSSYAYRFGPPGFDVVVASLERDIGGATDLVSQAVHFPSGRPVATEPADRLGVKATGRREGEELVVTVRSTRFAHGVRLQLPGFDPCDDAFPVEPGGSRTIRLSSTGHDRCTGGYLAGRVSAINLAGFIDIDWEEA